MPVYIHMLSKFKKHVKSITLMLYSLANNGKLSGRADGNVYNKNGVVRGMKVPRLVQNTYTGAARNRFGSNSSDWNALTDSERLTWINATGFTTSDRFGRTIPLVGKQLFVSLNNNLDAVDFTTISEAPLPTTVDGITKMTPSTFDASASTCAIAYEPEDVPADTNVLVFATGGKSAGTYRPGQSQYRVIGVITGGSSSPFAAGAPYVAKFGTPAVGTKIFFKMISINTTTGQAAPPIFASTTVVA